VKDRDNFASLSIFLGGKISRDVAGVEQVARAPPINQKRGRGRGGRPYDELMTGYKNPSDIALGRGRRTRKKR